MRPALIGMSLPALLLLATPPALAASGCAASPSGAVLQALTAGAGGEAQAGFRVRKVLFDPLLQRSFIQVESCDHPERPLVLLPFAQVESPSVAAAGQAFHSLPVSVTGPIARAGSVVTVVMGTEHARLTTQGRLLSDAAAAGSEVEVELRSMMDSQAFPAEPARRVRGRLTALDRVEVQQ